MPLSLIWKLRITSFDAVKSYILVDGPIAPVAPVGPWYYGSMLKRPTDGKKALC